MGEASRSRSGDRLLRADRRMRFATVVFDCDSTLSHIEGIDSLTARRSGEVQRQVESWTREAMAGGVPLEDVYRRRLELVRPTAGEVAEVAHAYRESVVDEAREVVQILRRLGKRVVVVSGGLEPAVRPFAEWLGIATEEIFAVPIQFAPSGDYEGFDPRHPLARSGGKRQILGAVPSTSRPCCLIGDGMTDLEASDVCERFIGFGGVVARDVVRQAAEFFVEQHSLRAVLPLVLDEEEQRFSEIGLP